MCTLAGAHDQAKAALDKEAAEFSQAGPEPQ
jgi:hypothetical protein